jgi:4-carboxymuconolactone decarboxylase
MAVSLNEQQLRRLAQDFDHDRSPDFLYCPLLSGAIASRQEAGMRMVMNGALAGGVRPRTLREIILQSHLFLGFPAMIEAAHLLAEVCPSRTRCDQLPGAYTAAADRKRHHDGLVKVRRMYGRAFDRLVAYINSASPQILTWLINDAYGRVLSRPGVSFAVRETSIIATLTVTAYHNQLVAHIRGALHIGLDRGLLEQTIDNCRFFCPPSRIAVAHETLTRMLAD